MAEEFKLGPDEAVVLRTEKVGGEGFFIPTYNNVLVLTNQNIIYIKKDMFGQTTDTLYYPLKDIKVVNGKPQIRKGKIDAVAASLEVFMNNGVETFRFEWGTDVDEWLLQLESVITGEPVKRKSNDEILAEAMAFADSIEAPIEKMKDIFGIKSNKQVSCKCPSCGATLTGIKGETTQCPYCGTYHTF